MITREAWDSGLDRAIVAAADASGVDRDDIDVDVVQAVYESVVGCARPSLRELVVSRRDSVEEFVITDGSESVRIADSCDYVTIHKEDLPKVINWLESAK